jgi:hypothetical protein
MIESAGRASGQHFSDSTFAFYSYAILGATLMNPIVLGLYLLSALAIVLGFIALLAQRVYLDRETNTPVEVSLPILGRIKTNYPALVLFLAGVAMALYAFNEAHQATDRWRIAGSLKLPDELDDVPPELRDQLRRIDWQEGDLDVLPTFVADKVIRKDGLLSYGWTSNKERPQKARSP